MWTARFWSVTSGNTSTAGRKLSSARSSPARRSSGALSCLLHSVSKSGRTAFASPTSACFAPPLICIEIVARNDSFMLLLQRLDDYVGMGVANIWVVDPHTRRGYRYTNEGLLEATDGVLHTSNPDLAVPLNALFG